MTKTTRARYTLEFKQEAVRLVEGGQSIAAARLPFADDRIKRAGPLRILRIASHALSAVCALDENLFSVAFVPPFFQQRLELGPK